uniref:Uncharacterized protein n=1 Tax=Octopus bimaculoides TaxID=37653 RepID=A0A0L8H8K3_OCTBM
MIIIFIILLLWRMVNSVEHSINCLSQHLVASLLHFEFKSCWDGVPLYLSSFQLTKTVGAGLSRATTGIALYLFYIQHLFSC